MDVYLAQGETGEGGGSLLLPLLMIVALFAIFYFMAVRPNQRRRQKLEKLQSEIAVGDEVMTTSGLYATVAEVDDKTLILETSEGVYSRYARGAIIEVVSSAHALDDAGPDTDSEASSGVGSDTPAESRDTKD